MNILARLVGVVVVTCLWGATEAHASYSTVTFGATFVNGLTSNEDLVSFQSPVADFAAQGVELASIDPIMLSSEFDGSVENAVASLAVVPEPAAFGWLGGILLFAVAARQLRRSQTAQRTTPAATRWVCS